MINRNRKLDKTRVVLQDIEDIKNEIKLEALLKKSPKFDINKAVKVITRTSCHAKAKRKNKQLNGLLKPLNFQSYEMYTMW